MLTTLGAILLSLQFMFTMSSIANAPAGIGLPSKTIPYKEDPVLMAVVDHYNTKGQWAGTFKIESVIKSKIIKVSETETIAHVKYNYVFVPNNAKGRTDSGFDQRMFTLSTIGDEVIVTKMGPYRSARF